jgi:hypothetical protein
MSKCVTALALFIITAGSLTANALTVEEAYRAIPHNRTVFDAHASKLSAVQINALKQLFDLSDKGVVLRVEGLNAFSSDNLSTIQSVLSGYRTLTSALLSLQAPDEIKPAQDLVLQSIQLHQRYFEARLHEREASDKVELLYRRNPEVGLASQKLQAAYGVLMNRFPNEPAVNQRAFYDYLCALDFL